LVRKPEAIEWDEAAEEAAAAALKAQGGGEVARAH
jgi:ATP-dependent Lon protease